MKQLLSVIIPVFNEESTIQPLLDKVAAVRIPGIPLEIIVVNDGSTDRTPDKIREWKESLSRRTGFPHTVQFLEKENGGKGSAVRLGIEHCTGGVVIIQDADLEYDPEDYEACIRPILNGECKVVYGTREDANRNRIYSSPGYFLGALSLTFWINLLFNANLTDEPTCYKTFDGDLIRSLSFEGNRFDWEPEITSKLLRLGFAIREVPVTYLPRSCSEGKKIKFKDGIQSFGVVLRWRFRSLRQEKNRLVSLDPAYNAQIRRVHHAQLALLTVTFLAILVRLIYSIPALQEPSLVMRLDSAGFLGSARQLLETGAYPTDWNAMRPPFYPCWLALCLLLGGGSLSFCIVMSCIIGGLTVCPVYMASRLAGSWKVAFFAALLFALNPTAIALSPMFLSDTLFTAVLAFQLLFFLKFIRSRFAMFFFAAVFFASLGAMVRQANLLWILPCLFVLWVLPKFPVRLKLWYSLFAVLLFGIMPGAWIMRNHSLDAGYRFDVTGGNMMLHNVSIIESRRTGEPEPVIRERRKAEMTAYFEAHPEQFTKLSDRLDYQEKTLSREMFRQPAAFARLYLHPYTFLPDLPSFMENLGLSTGDRGTMDVLNRRGIFAAVNHYFNGNYGLILLGLPVLAAAGLLYLLAGACLLRDLLQRRWIHVLLFLLLAEYYLFLPGAVPMPRYQLPALLMFCVMAASFTTTLLNRVFSSADAAPKDRIR